MAHFCSAENIYASALRKESRSLTFGFNCIHYSVMENSGTLTVKVDNLSGRKGKVAVRTVDGDAKANDDFLSINEELEFVEGEQTQEVIVSILNSKATEPDEEFYLELYDQATGKRLPGVDTRTTITIIDDDRPPVICFKERGVIEHLASDRHVRVPVQRLYNSDGKVTVRFKTAPIDKDALKGM